MAHKKYRAALIGCGAIGSKIDEGGNTLGIQTHAAAYQACSRTELVGICDVDADRVAACAKNRNVVRYYQDHRAMLESCFPDVVSIATATSSHDHILHDVLDFPGVKLVICEKPIASNFQIALDVVRKAEAVGCRLVVNYSRHYLPVMAQVRNIIGDGKIGAVRLVNGFYTKTLVHNGTHLLDLLFWWFGRMQLVHAEPGSWAKNSNDFCNVTLKMAGGMPVYLHSLDAKDYSLFEIDIIGSSGRISITHGGNVVKIWEVEDHMLFAGYREFAANPRVTENCLNDLMLTVIETSLDMLGGDEDAATRCCMGNDSLAVLKLAEDAVDLAGARI
ncbi:MAG: Gfo/Idh/MocA family oxidoreductase [Pseudomonadota bacterium]